ncbi:Ectoine hydroxylase [Castellaniella defragrans 65Phen]|uniref:Ectoine hydroxylase n=2 Tax=Castellaniella defragrans TaxID=75697 RepID=W8X3S5_CASD6|nr:ectoine hydroxylase [Castellaniella defragrans]CDM23951.1 Ectoine hydroxylase [Castellaniella defragrans 65Phen]
MKDFYVSRTGRDAALIARGEPVVYGEGRYADALDEGQLQAYERDGFLILPGVFGAAEIQALREEAQALEHDPAVREGEEVIREPGGTALRSIFRVHELGRRLAELPRDPRLLDVARQILGSEVYIHQSRVNMKPALDGKEFYWHSDFETWHVEDGMPAMRALSCSVLLTDNTAFNGPLMLIPGSHRQFVACVGETPEDHYRTSLRRQEVGVPDPVSLRLLAERGGLEAAIAPAGSVVFFDCNTLHGSAGNLSPWPRSNVFMVYNSVENRLQAPFHGMKPRPEHIAARRSAEPLTPLRAAA